MELRYSKAKPVPSPPGQDIPFLRPRPHIKLIPNHWRMAGLSEQYSLFADAPSGPAGLSYSDNFITAAEERDLVAHIAALPLQPFQFGAFEGKRRVASFGFRYDYKEGRLQEADPIPAWVADTVARVEA